jgi:hypothetical protein
MLTFGYGASVNCLEVILHSVAQLREIVARLRRLMPLDRDVQAVCSALQGVLDMQPKDKKAERFKRAQVKAARREYQRKWMAKHRAELKRNGGNHDHEKVET